jgi:hypothetical protein
MKEHPIIFSGEMVRAILEGRKTQTRRVMKPQPGPTTSGYMELLPGRFKPIRSLPEFDGKIGSKSHKKAAKIFYDDEDNETRQCPCGQPEDHLWVRETWTQIDYDQTIIYRADCDQEAEGVIREDGYKWKSSIFMPHWASRITLEITDVRVERLQDINSESHDDVLKEGWPFEEEGKTDENPVFLFRRYWDSLNAKRGFGWETNLFVWVISFKRIEQRRTP